MASPSPPTPSGATALTRLDGLLILLVLFAWSTSWIGVHLQLGTVPPEVSVFWRFVLAGLFMLGWCVVRGERLRGYTRRDHLAFAALGATLFSWNFVLFYHAGLLLVSGMLSVVFALAAPGNALIQAIILKRPITPAAVAGSLIGVAGVATLFLPEALHSGIGHVEGLLLAALGTGVFCTGNLVSARVQERGVPLAPATAWGMGYGAAVLGVVCAVRGDSFAPDPSATYIGSLVYLALVASVVAFMSYLSLLRRIGPARAGYLTVLLPVFALGISTLAEGYQWTAWSLAGLALVGIGNVLVLWRPRTA